MRHPAALFALAALLAVGVTACTYYVPRHDDPGAYRYDYYYYPHLGVYFHLYSGHYYYRDGAAWVRVRALPHHIHLDHRVRRTLVIKDPEPYRRHERHREHYRPPADFRQDRAYDRPERQHNERQHQEYRRRWEHAGPARR
jgi:hypothetical protein